MKSEIVILPVSTRLMGYIPQSTRQRWPFVFPDLSGKQHRLDSR